MHQEAAVQHSKAAPGPIHSLAHSHPGDVLHYSHFLQEATEQLLPPPLAWEP